MAELERIREDDVFIGLTMTRENYLAVQLIEGELTVDTGRLQITGNVVYLQWSLT